MKNNLFKATIIIFVLTLIAKLIAFLKSIFQASIFGATIQTDAFNVANGFVGNILYMCTTSVAVAFVPFYIKNKSVNNEKIFATKTITFFFIIAILLTIGLICCAPGIVKIIAPSYTKEIHLLTVQYFRVLCLGFVFALAASMYTQLLNAEKIYGFSAIGSIINSIVLMALMFLFSNTLGVWILVISMPVSYLIQWIVLSLKGNKYAKISLKYGLYDNSMKALSLQTMPILLSQATVEINQVVDRALLTSLGTGALTAVSYSAILYQFASTLISTPLSTVMFTELSEASVKLDRRRIKVLLNNCYKVILIVGIPITIVIYFCSVDIVEIVYGYGQFSGNAISQCSVGLQMYGLCLLPVCIKSVLNKAYYSLNDTKRPMIIGIFEVALNIGLSVALYQPLGILGVVGSTAIASIVCIIIMIVDFNRKFVKVVDREALKSYWKLFFGIVIILSGMFLLKDTLLYNYLVDFILKTIISIGGFILILILLKDTTMLKLVQAAWRKIYPLFIQK